MHILSLKLSPYWSFNHTSEVKLEFELIVSINTQRFSSIPLKSYMAIAANTITITRTRAQMLAIEGMILIRMLTKFCKSLNA